MSILNQQKIEKIFQSQEDISFKKYFETNLNTLGRSRMLLGSLNT